MSQGKKVFIIAGGEIGNGEYLRSRIGEEAPAAIICADGGARHAWTIGIIPQMIVGDMDSLSPEIINLFTEKGVTLCRFPSAKDETDTALAFEAACGYQPSEIWVFGALGHRLDHTLANLALLLKGEERRIPVRLLDEWCEVFLVTDACTIEGSIGQTVSLLPFFGAATGVTLTGFQYPLEKGVMSMSSPFGISNRLAADKGKISIETGCLIVIRYFQQDIFPS